MEVDALHDRAILTHSLTVVVCMCVPCFSGSGVAKNSHQSHYILNFSNYHTMNIMKPMNIIQYTSYM
jgi:hypothetical protein